MRRVVLRSLIAVLSLCVAIGSQSALAVTASDQVEEPSDSADGSSDLAEDASNPSDALSTPAGQLSVPAERSSGDEGVAVSVSDEASELTDGSSVSGPAGAGVSGAATERYSVLVEGYDGRLSLRRGVRQPKSSGRVLASGTDGRVWGAASPDPRRGSQWPLDAVPFESAWASSDGTGAVVAVIDSGVRVAHDDLRQAVLPGRCFITLDDGSLDPLCPDDGAGQGVMLHPHGTHISGILAATAANDRGIAGASPGARVLPLRVLDDDNVGFLSDVTDAVLYAIQTDLDGDGATPDVEVINLSIETDFDFAPLEVALERAATLGVVVVAAAGNGGAGASVTFPAAYEGVIGVGAVRSSLEVASFSSRGSWVDLTAPGVAVLSTWSTADNAYDRSQGTSMATPHVAAAAAMLAAARPDLGPAEIATALTATARDRGASGRDDAYGFGLVDPAAALARVGAAPVGAPAVLATPFPRAVSLTWDPIDAPQVTAIRIMRDGTRLVDLDPDATSHVDVSPPGRGEHTYQVLPLVHYETAGPGAAVTATPLLAPTAPVDLRATDEVRLVELSWRAPVDDGGQPLTGYRVSATPDGAPAPSVTRELGPDERRLDLVLDERGAPYLIEVVALNELGAGEVATVSANPLPPPLPTAVPAPVLDERADGVLVSWSAPVGIVDTIQVLRDGALVAELGPEAVSWIDVAPEPGPHRYVVRLVNSAGQAASAASVIRVSEVPAAPVDLTVVPEVSALDIRWQAPASTIERYRVDIVDPDGVGRQVTATELSVTVEGLEPGTVYAVTVRAESAGRLGQPAGLTVSTLDRPVDPSDRPPGAPGTLRLDQSGRTITLAWSAASGSVDRYVVERTVVGTDRWAERGRTTATGFVDRSVPPGERYAYRVVAVNAAGSVSSSTAVSALVSAPVRPGYWLVTRSAEVLEFGAAVALSPERASAGRSVVAATASSDGRGLYLLFADGRVVAEGTARHRGDLGEGVLNRGERATSISVTPTGDGYWVFTDRGRVGAFGDAEHLGDLLAIPLNGSIIDSAATTTGRGYYLIGSDGGVFTFGDAEFRGSLGGIPLNGPVVGVVPTAAGYWLVADDGGIFSFGDAPFHGSLGGIPLNRPIVGAVRSGGGYLMVGADGGVFTFGPDVDFLGSGVNRDLSAPVVAIAPLR